MKKNEVFPLTITGMSSEGYGVGRHENMAVFVPLAAVGDQLVVRAVKVKDRYAYGKIEEILFPASCRIQPDCPVSRQCGGCAYRHLSSQEEQRLKLQQVNDALQRIGGVNSPVTEILSTGRERYRNKAQYPLCSVEGRIVVGFYAPHSHRVIPYWNCLLTPECFEPLLHTVTEFLERHHIPVYNEVTHTGVARHIYIRWGEVTEEIMVCLVANATHIPAEKELAAKLREADPRVKSVILNTNCEQTNVILGKRCRVLWGSASIEDVLCGIKVSLSPLSFYQINRRAAELLYEKAGQFAQLTKNDLLLDLYCGAGTIGLSMAHQAGRVVGVEVVPEAIENAKENARKNGISNAEFFCGDASEAVRRFREEGKRPTVVVLDPPRKGCDEFMLQNLTAMEPLRIVYVSCNPATLARDVKRLEELGYHFEQGVAVDLFGGTAHVETVIWMSKNKQNHLEK